MTTNIISFSPQILSSITELHNFFQSAPEIEEIRKDSQKGTTTSPAIARLHDRWNVTCLDIQSTAEYLFSGFAVAISAILNAIGATDLSKRCYVYSRHLLASVSLLSTFHKYRDNFLMPAMNAHRQDTADFYTQPPLEDPFPQTSPPPTLNFYHPQGVCRGMCDWFLFLYFQSRHLFTSPEEHLKAVAKQFEEGASRQAALLQTFSPQAIEEILNLHVEGNLMHFSAVNTNISEIVPQIYALPLGTYALYFKGHRINLLKESAGLFIFDPNPGLLKISNSIQLEMAIRDAMSILGSNQQILIDKVTPF